MSDKHIANITSEKTYQIEKDGLTYSGLKKVDEWEGLYKLKNGNDIFIVAVEGVFSNIREALNKETDSKVTVVKAPPRYWKEKIKD